MANWCLYWRTGWFISATAYAAERWDSNTVARTDSDCTDRLATGEFGPSCISFIRSAQRCLLTDLSCDIIYHTIHSPHQWHRFNHKNINCRSDWQGRQHRRLARAANTLAPPLPWYYYYYYYKLTGHGSCEEHSSLNIEQRHVQCSTTDVNDKHITGRQLLMQTVR